MDSDRNVWVVDDDEDDSYLLGFAFKSLPTPVKIKIITKPAELMPALVQAIILPRLLLLDEYMNDQKGHELLVSIRSNPTFQSIAIIILTGAEELDFNPLKDAGADGLLFKPKTWPVLQKLVTDLAQKWLN